MNHLDSDGFLSLSCLHAQTHTHTRASFDLSPVYYSCFTLSLRQIKRFDSRVIFFKETSSQDIRFCLQIEGCFATSVTEARRVSTLLLSRTRDICRATSVFPHSNTRDQARANYINSIKSKKKTILFIFSIVLRVISIKSSIPKCCKDSYYVVTLQLCIEMKALFPTYPMIYFTLPL